jgi:hypothetical protein
MAGELIENFRLLNNQHGIKKTLTIIKEDMASLAKEVFSASFKGIFENHPKLKMVSWTAYTPSWNDGEPCEFGSNHSYPEINNEEETEYEDMTKAEENDARKAVSTFLASFDDNDMKVMFGEDIMVIVRPSGVVVEEYDCGY